MCLTALAFAFYLGIGQFEIHDIIHLANGAVVVEIVTTKDGGRREFHGLSPSGELVCLLEVEPFEISES